MKKVLILVLVVLCVAVGCQKKAAPENWSEFSAEELQAPQKPFPILSETIRLKEMLPDSEAAYIFVADSSPGVVTLASGDGTEMTMTEYDIYSKTVLREMTVTGVDYYFSSYELVGKRYAICGQVRKNEEGMDIVLLDVWNNQKVASFVSQTAPLHTRVEDAIMFSGTEQGGTKSTLYQFDNGVLQEIGVYTCKITGDGHVTGEVITALGGFEDTLWAQVSKAKKQLLQEAHVMIEQYKAKRELIDPKSDALQTRMELTNTVTVDTPFSFLFGNSQQVLGGLNAELNATQENGMLVDLQTKTIAPLEGVKPGNSLLFAAPWQEGYIYGTQNSVNYINLKTKEQEVLYHGEVLSITANEGIVAVQTAEDIVLLQSNHPKIIGEIDSAVVKNLQTAMNLPDVEQLYETENCIYYLESSSYAHRQYQGADGIIWEYDKKTEQCKKMEEFFYIFSSNEVEVDEAAQTFTYVLDDPKDKSDNIIVSFR